MIRCIKPIYCLPIALRYLELVNKVHTLFSFRMHEAYLPTGPIKNMLSEVNVATLWNSMNILATLKHQKYNYKYIRST
jgi:hypothetical protein